ncbi:DUF2630 family protein [Calidifontibacter sp. DB0510]|uniref:DUF2630 family protein n=1 Tax=Metallococcus carri TaxID=1656884 RepID=A0A967AYZ7_9MICO|nr:DUF2630 family protein [Metallococcus carri]NHN54999.1 DUF2630 family protein [Metallococcus carri]NOP37345.1 DUF2630 family protein [Calidifontibacter sp. DB2511S]
MATFDDAQIHQQIDALVQEERTLREKLGRGEITAAEERQRLQAAETTLDRLWDLLRRRDARREFGENPDDATEQSATVVEGYQQ